MTPRSTILCIEDEADLRELIADELRDAGYRVIEAADGEAGIRLITDRRPDLVLCDITMPGLDGYEILARLRADSPDLADMPFVFLSALADRKDVIAGKTLGADDYLTKPVDFDIMRATIAARLRQVTAIRSQNAADQDRQRLAFEEALDRACQASFAAGLEVLNGLAVAILLLGEDRHVVFANQHAEDLLKRNDGLMLHHGRLHTTNPQHRARLDSLLSGLSANHCQRRRENASARRSKNASRMSVGRSCEGRPGLAYPCSA